MPARHILIWIKNNATFSMNRLDYDYQHELIFYGWKAMHKFYGGGKHKTSVWKINRPSRSEDHPTMKPVELVLNAILNSSKENDIVLDGFTGSGTTLIACEDSKRNFRGLEIEPHYCDVILKRWINHVPKGKITRNGKEFSL
jgi:DNA modification methylase